VIALLKYLVLSARNHYDYWRCQSLIPFISTNKIRPTNPPFLACTYTMPLWHGISSLEGIQFRLRAASITSTQKAPKCVAGMLHTILASLCPQTWSSFFSALAAFVRLASRSRRSCSDRSAGECHRPFALFIPDPLGQVALDQVLQTLGRMISARTWAICRSLSHQAQLAASWQGQGWPDLCNAGWPLAISAIWPRAPWDPA